MTWARPCLGKLGLARQRCLVMGSFRSQTTDHNVPFLVVRGALCRPQLRCQTWDPERNDTFLSHLLASVCIWQQAQGKFSKHHLTRESRPSFYLQASRPPTWLWSLADVHCLESSFFPNVCRFLTLELAHSWEFVDITLREFHQRLFFWPLLPLLAFSFELKLTLCQYWSFQDTPLFSVWLCPLEWQNEG